MTSDDPLAIFETWLHQLSGTAEDAAPQPGWSCDTSIAPARRCRVESSFRDFAGSLELWATDADPILIIDIGPSSGEPTLGLGGGFVRKPAPPEQLSGQLGGSGDLLIEEQGFELHLPPATRAGTPEIPTNQGSSFVVFAAEDGAAAVACRRAVRGSPSSRSGRPVDPVATVYVTSLAG